MSKNIELDGAWGSFFFKNADGKARAVGIERFNSRMWLLFAVMAALAFAAAPLAGP